jgi:uncharacterized membrane protein
LIIGFIIGSLGMVWPWKNKIFAMQNGSVLLDSQNNPVLENYQRFVPDFAEINTWISIGYVVMGMAIVIGIDYFEHQKKKQK